MLSPFKISWNGLSSLDLNLWTELSIGGSDNGATTSFLNRESVQTERYDGRYRRIYGYKYQDVLTPTITFIKQDYKDFTSEENRRVLSWLTASDKPGWLEIYHDDTEVLSYQLFGNWTEIEQHKLASGRVIGYTCSFESSNPYAWSVKHEITKQYSMFGTFDITCHSDEYNKLLYPTITIKFSDDSVYVPIDRNILEDEKYNMIPNVIYSYQAEGDDEPTLYVNVEGNRVETWAVASNAVASSYTLGKYYYFPSDLAIKKTIATELSNGTTSYHWEKVTQAGSAVQIGNSYTLNGENITKETVVSGGEPGEIITLDGTNKVISSNQDEIVKIMGDNFNWEWFALAPGINNITIAGNCEVKLEWLEPRKVGDL